VGLEAVAPGSEVDLVLEEDRRLAEQLAHPPGQLLPVEEPLNPGW
jgi:hypothetical protein